MPAISWLKKDYIRINNILDSLEVNKSTEDFRRIGAPKAWLFELFGNAVKDAAGHFRFGNHKLSDGDGDGNFFIVVILNFNGNIASIHLAFDGSAGPVFAF